MSQDRDLEERVERWLKHEAPPLPPRVRAAVRDEVDRRPQLPEKPGIGPIGRIEFERRWGRRLRPVELAAAAGFAVLVLGGLLAALWRVPGPGGIGSARPSNETAALTSPPSGTPVASLPGSEADPFTGTWSTLDEDGSQMTLNFEGAGASRRARIVDLRATVCGGEAHLLEGTGTIDGDSIHVIGAAGCSGEPQDEPFTAVYTYDAPSGTIRSPVEFAGGDHLTWSRGPVPLDAFRGRWVATDIDDTALELILEGAAGLGREVTYHDEHAQFCTGLPGYTARGAGTIGAVSGDDRFLRVTLAGACDDGSSPRAWEHKYEFEWATGTLVGPLAPLETGGTRGIETVVWTRPSGP